MIEVFFSDKYIYQLPENHRFPIQKYELVKEQLVYEGTLAESQIVNPGLCPEKYITLIHQDEYWYKLKNLKLEYREIRKIGLPVTEMSVNRARNSVAGTLNASLQALGIGLGVNLSGGTHHAYSDHGEGFCILNDIAIAATYLLAERKVNRVLVVDLDVHQGNGTAKIFANIPEVFTFSMHGKANYPLIKEKSDLDIDLPTDTKDEVYLEILNKTLPELISKQQPDIIFYQAGVDVLETDKLGKLALTKSGCQTRDEIVLKACAAQKIPVVITMGGGYSSRMADIVDAHCNTFRTAIRLFD